MMTIVNLSNSIQSLIFSFLELGIFMGSLGIIFFRKVIYSALLLGLVFVCIALLYLLLNADFLAAAQVLIYIGAVNVLIIFAIMLVNKPDLEQNDNFTFGEVISTLVSIGLFGLLTNIIFGTSWQSFELLLQNQIPIEPLSPSINIIGLHFLTDFLLPFELLSILLLVALIGAIVIARKESRVQ